METKKVKFVTLTQQRSGSTWLMDLLNNHPECQAYSEPFVLNGKEDNLDKLREQNLIYEPTFYTFRKNSKGFRPFTVFRYLKKMESSFTKSANGFKLMHSQIANYPEILLWLSLKRYKVVRLIRQDHLQKVLSDNIRRNTNIAHEHKGQNEEVDSFMLKPKSVKEEIEYRKKQTWRLNQAARFLPMQSHEMYYQDIKDKTRQTMNGLADFLQISHQQKWNTSMQKISKSKEDIIENHDEIIDKLDGK